MDAQNEICKRLNLPKTEEIFAVMESLEYQSV
nr:MAG TPA: Z DNA-binding protein [Caudoviricetes sp.]